MEVATDPVQVEGECDTICPIDGVVRRQPADAIDIRRVRCVCSPYVDGIFYQWPFSGAWAIGVLVGVKLLFAGFSMIALGSLASGVAKRIADIGENA